jgi:hypothetical protein
VPVVLSRVAKQESALDNASRVGSVPGSLTGDMARQIELDNMAKKDDDEFEELLAKVFTASKRLLSTLCSLQSYLVPWLTSGNSMLNIS